MQFLKFITGLFIFCFASTAFAQNVVINTDGSNPDSSAMLDVQSINRGILIPRVTAAQRLLILGPANSLMVYQTDTKPGYYFNQGTPLVPNWIRLVDTSDISGIGLNEVLLNGNNGGDQSIVNVNSFGIGTSTTNYEFQINEAAGVNSFFQITVASLGTGPNDGFRIGLDNGVARIINEENSNITLETNGISRVIIDSTGNVGIGNSIPNYLLNVDGRTMVDTLEINSEYTFPSTDGNPNQILETDGLGIVNWVDLIPDTLTIIQDLDSDTRILVDSASADDDIIHFELGGTEYFRMQSNRLEVLNSGFSIFIGDSAGFNDDLTNNYNVAIGQGALFSNLTGERNMAVGFNALRNNTSGNFNSSIGAESNRSNTTGSYNTSVGYFANGLNTQGDFNVAIGYGANYNNQIGDQNIAFGLLAGFGAAGVSKTNNVYIGTLAGYQHTGDSSIFIGNRAGFSDTRSNVFYLDNNFSANPLMFGDFSKNTLTVNDTLAIGTYTPNEKLDVEGSIEVDGDYKYENAKTMYYSLPAIAFNSYRDAGVSNNQIANTSDPDGVSIYEDYGGNDVPAYFAAPVYLPDSTVITEVTLYLRDNTNSKEIGGELRRHTLGTDQTTLVDLTNIGSTGAAFDSGLVTLSDNTINNPLVDNRLYSYYIRIVTEESIAQLRIYGARITYLKNKAD